MTLFILAVLWLLGIVAIGLSVVAVAIGCYAIGAKLFGDDDQ